MEKKNRMRMAIVHDFLVNPGGAERVLKVISDMYPEAPIYTLLYDREKMGKMFKGRKIFSSYLRRFPKFLRKRYQWLMPFFPVIPETFDLREYDLVISSSGAWSKGIVTKLDTIHVAYIHSPMRYVWDSNATHLKEKKKESFFIRFFFSYFRIWDRLAADRPDHLIANSEYTRQRIRKYYRRDSQVIYPPVSTNFQPALPKLQQAELRPENKIQDTTAGYEVPDTEYFLVVSRLSPYKKVDLAVEVFNKLGLALIVIGEGEQLEYLKKIAAPNVRILGWQSDAHITRYYKGARAFIFPCEDDFGMTAVESMQQGVPVIAYRAGGVVETVQEGVTGEFFGSQTVEVLADAVSRFVEHEKQYDRQVIRKRGQDFSKEVFQRKFQAFIDACLDEK